MPKQYSPGLVGAATREHQATSTQATSARAILHSMGLVKKGLAAQAKDSASRSNLWLRRVGSHGVCSRAERPTWSREIGSQRFSGGATAPPDPP
eukprot:8748922-Alexandrium_andersonii.AAC.1